jgi:thiol-disulfide isomerase/thioredoxin
MIDTGIKAVRGVKKIEFYTAPFCGICREVFPFVTEQAAKADCQIVKIDVSTASGKEAGRQQQVVYLPCLIIYSESGEAFARMDKKSDILSDLANYLGNRPNYVPPTTDISRTLILGSMSALGGLIALKILSYFNIKKE